jgi:quinolinate synthase
MVTAVITTAEQLYAKLKNVRVGGSVCQYSLKKCEELVVLINEINRLKKEKDAVILVHSYASPELVYGVADYVGDSYKLSRDAIKTKAKTIVFVAVRFMGETAKIVNPNKEVLVPAREAGCTLADAITAEDVRRLKKEFPGYAFVCYVNTTAEVKAECEVCVTSANVYQVVERMPSDKIYFLPDKFMGMNLKNEMVKRGVKKDIQFFSGTCYVHEEYTQEQIFKVRTEYPGVKIVSHPECNADVVANSDFVGGTEQMLDYMRKTQAKQFLMLTECGLSSRLQSEFPDKELVGSCSLCKYMKSNTLEDVLRVLKAPTDKERIEIPEDVRVRALKSLEAMFKYAEPGIPKKVVCE